MGDIVSDETTFSCPYCTSQLKICVPSSAATGDSKKLANTDNFLFPPPPGAQCLLIPNAPVPCAPPSVSVVTPGQSAVAIDGKQALGVSCQLQCAKGGLLSVASVSQSSAKHDEASAWDKAIDILAVIADAALLVLSKGKSKNTVSKVRAASKAGKALKNTRPAAKQLPPPSQAPSPPTHQPPTKSNATGSKPPNQNKATNPTPAKQKTPPRTEPRNLEEKLALDEAKAGAGKPIEGLEIKDPRYPPDKFDKMEHVHKTPGESLFQEKNGPIQRSKETKSSDIHFWQNKETGERSGFKFKDYK